MKLERLSCRKRVALLCDYLDRELPESQRRVIAEHRRSCRPCSKSSGKPGANGPNAKEAQEPRKSPDLSAEETSRGACAPALLRTGARGRPSGLSRAGADAEQGVWRAPPEQSGRRWNQTQQEPSVGRTDEGEGGHSQSEDDSDDPLSTVWIFVFMAISSVLKMRRRSDARSRKACLPLDALESKRIRAGILPATTASKCYGQTGSYHHGGRFRGGLWLRMAPVGWMLDRRLPDHGQPVCQHALWRDGRLDDRADLITAALLSFPQ